MYIWHYYYYYLKKSEKAFDFRSGEGQGVLGGHHIHSVHSLKFKNLLTQHRLHEREYMKAATATRVEPLPTTTDGKLQRAGRHKEVKTRYKHHELTYTSYFFFCARIPLILTIFFLLFIWPHLFLIICGVQEGNIFFKEGKFKKAISTYSKAIAYTHGLPGSQRSRGMYDMIFTLLNLH